MLTVGQLKPPPAFMTLGSRSFQFNPSLDCCWWARNFCLAVSLAQFPILCPVSLQYLHDLLGLVLPSFPAESWGSWCLPKKGLLLPCHWPELADPKPDRPTLVACKSLVKAICKDVGFKNSQIWDFLAIAWSNLERRSLICEDWVLIFLSHLLSDLDSTSSPSDSTSADETDMALVDTLLALMRAQNSS